MARMPGAVWKPLADNWASQPRMRAYDFFCLHTMVGGLDGTDGYFRNVNGAGYGGTESHFGVGPNGTIYQWQDTDFQADANGNGNWHVISSENADTGAPFPAWGGSDVPAFTPQQVEANARIAVWLYRTHGIPLELTPDSKPGRRGLAVHRWGVPGYMVAGAEQWSSSTGKACPGDRRVAQAPQVSALAQQLSSGINPGGFLMALSSEQQDDLYRKVSVVYEWLTKPGTGVAARLAELTGRPAADVDEDRVAAALAVKLSGQVSGDSVTADQVRDALREVLRDGVGAGA